MTTPTPGTFDTGAVSTAGAGVAPSTLIPPRRLGRILSAARAEAGLTLEDVAALSQGRFTLSALSSIERGTWELSDEDARRLADMYHVESTALVPPRSQLIVDLDEGFLAVEDYRTSVQRHTPSKDEVLARYLTMVYSMRRIDPGKPLTLRVEDLDVLGRALRVGTGRLEADLEALMTQPADLVRWRDRVLKRRVLIPAAGVLVASLGVGALVLIQGPEPVNAQPSNAPSQLSSASIAVPVDIGTAIVQERNADGTPGEPRIRTGADTSVGTADVDAVVGVDGDASVSNTGTEADTSVGTVGAEVGLIPAETLER